MPFDARMRHPANPREQTMTTYGDARVSRVRDDETDTLQNQRMRLTDVGVDRLETTLPVPDFDSDQRVKLRGYSSVNHRGQCT